jgi:hypothetical protein
MPKRTTLAKISDQVDALCSTGEKILLRIALFGIFAYGLAKLLRR